MPQIRIAGHAFEAPDRYSEGHTLNAAEASALNSLMRENVGNNFRKRASDPNADFDALQREFAEAFEGYNFGIRGTRISAPSDPVGAEAHRLAVDHIRKALKAKGKRIGGKDPEVTAAQINEAAKRLVDSKPEYRAQAERIVAERAQLSGGEDVLGMLEDAPAPQVETETETPQPRRRRA